MRHLWTDVKKEALIEVPMEVKESSYRRETGCFNRAVEESLETS